MASKITSKISKVIIVVVMAVTVLLPARASALTPEQLLILTDRLNQLCTSRIGPSTTAWCTFGKDFETISKAVFALPEDERADYIKNNGSEHQDEVYLKVVEAYNNALADGKIVTTTDVEGVTSPDANGDCPAGQVAVSISPDGSDKGGCVGGTNPIYTYLKGIIYFMGGAIGLMVVITIIVAGIQYSSSNGNPANITKAKERLVNAMIGLLLYLFLAAILRYLVPQIFT